MNKIEIPVDDMGTPTINKIKFPNVEGITFEVHWTQPKKGHQRYETTSSTRAFRKYYNQSNTTLIPYYKGNEVMLRDFYSPYADELVNNYIVFLAELQGYIDREKAK